MNDLYQASSNYNQQLTSMESKIFNRLEDPTSFCSLEEWLYSIYPNLDEEQLHDDLDDILSNMERKGAIIHLRVEDNR